MATVRKRGKTYSARWTEADKSQGEKGGFPTRALARQYGMEREVEAKKGLRNSKNISQITLLEFIDSYWKNTLDVRIQTKLDYQNSINKYIIPYLGHRRIIDIKPMDIQTWSAKLKHEEKYFGKPLSPLTVQKYVNLLASILKVARENEFISHSPFEKIKRKKEKSRRKVVPLEYDQVLALVTRAPEHLKLLIWIPYFTGLRPSEVLGLTLDDIDFDTKRIQVRRQLSRDTSKIFEEYLKTDSSKREVSLAPRLASLIRNHITRFGLGPENLLFKNRLGKVLRYKDAARSFRLIARSLGFTSGDGMHLLRHTFASRLIRKGVSVKIIQTLLGHKEISETLDTYGHLFPGDFDSVIEFLDEPASMSEATSRFVISVVE